MIRLPVAGRLNRAAEIDNNDHPKDLGRIIIKAQAPLDNSSDGAGGIGRMVPAILLLHDPELRVVRLVVSD